MRQAFLWALLPSLVLVLIAPSAGEAQVATNITSSGLNTTVTQAGNLYDIGGGTRPGDGPNLFHSFGEFSVGQGDIGNFLNDTGLPTSNILGRVTGGNISNIDGNIQTTGFDTANLFLINPSGIVFGPHGSVNVGGSVSFSTAQYLRLSDGATNANFYANPANDGLANSILVVDPVVNFGFLLSAVPAAYGFLTAPDPNASITVQGSALSVPSAPADKPPNSISLVGGKVVIEGGAHLSAPSGRILLATSASPGEFDAATLQPPPNVDGASFTSSGSVLLAPGSSLDVSGPSTVFLIGGQLMLSVNDATLSTVEGPGPPDTILLSPGSAILTANSGTDPGADVQFIASNVLMDGAIIQTINSGDSDGGNVTIQGPLGPGSAADFVELTNGSTIQTTTFGPGRGGDVQLTAFGMAMENFSSIFTGAADGGGVGGDVVLNVGTGSLIGGASIQSATQNFTSEGGQGGDVTIQGLQGVGSAAHSVILSGGSSMLTQNFGVSGGGRVTVTAKSLTMDGVGTTISASANDVGRGGDIVVSVQKATLSDGATIIAQTASGDVNAQPGPTVTVQGLGGAESMADSVVLSGVGSGIISQTLGTARAGDIAVLAETVSLTDASTIRTQTSGPGRGGDVRLTADSLMLEKRSNISTDTLIGDGVGGDLILNVGTSLHLLGGSQIQSTNLNSGTDLDRDGLVDVTGVGGNVTVNAADSVVLSGGSRIVSSTSGSGQGGTITIQADQVLLDGPGTGISFDTPQPFANMTVTVNILHPNDGDLVVELTSPTGTHVTLLSRDGGDGDNFTFTQFNDHASTEITSGSAPFVGPFKPFEPLGQLIGQLSAGNWTLTVRDQATGKVGSLESWTLKIGQQIFESTGGSVAIPDKGSVQSTIAVTTPAGSTVPGPGEPAGISGDVTIHAGTVTVQNGATLSATTTGTGKGGTIIINATGPVVLSGSGSGLFTDSEASGAGGNIKVQASRITMDSGATVSASSSGTGNAGTITINAGSEFLSTNSTVTTEASQASGGNITLVASDMIHLRNSQISASVFGEKQTTGGNITIDPQFVILQNSQIIAQARAGSGGAINVTAGVFLVDPASIVDASSQLGVSGRVNISAQIQVLGGILVPLTQSFSQTSLSGDRCAADPTGQFSSFVQVGRDGVPQVPGALSPSPLSFLETLTSGSLGSPGPNWAAARLGLDSVSDPSLFWFHSACRS